VIASGIGVLSFNFFFTEPRFTFAVHDPGYLITFPIMLIVSLITSTLTSRIQYQVEVSSQRARKTDILLQISRSFLRTSGMPELINLSFGPSRETL
jgi:two-component system sensor histidine kinase KdpD